MKRNQSDRVPGKTKSVNASTPPKKSAKTVSKSSWGQQIIWGALFVTAASVSATVGATVAMFSPLPHLPQLLLGEDEAFAGGTSPQNLVKFDNIPLFQYKIERPVNILVMGIDRVPDAKVGSKEVFEGNTDTMLLLRFNPKDNSLRMLSIPRDTQVSIPEHGLRKINSANVEGGAKLATEVVSETLNDVPIDRYVRVTNNAFRELVDLVGGIEVFVPYTMSYSDKTQNLEINLKQGWQTLDGNTAEQFARFRMDRYGDIGRIQRQQMLLKVLREKLKNPTVLPHLPRAIQLMLEYVDTNLSLEEVLALVNFSMKLQQEDIKMVLLPGRFSDKEEFEGVSYWLMSPRGRDRVMSELFEREGDSISEQEREPHQVLIAIQNATNDPDIPRKAAEYLQKKGFYNFYFSEQNSSRLLGTTEIIVQQGDEKSAKVLKEAIGFGQVESDSTGDLGSEITLRLGSDWFDLKDIPQAVSQKQGEKALSQDKGAKKTSPQS